MMPFAVKIAKKCRSDFTAIYCFWKFETLVAAENLGYGRHLPDN
jgi:hypothetical protein